MEFVHISTTASVWNQIWGLRTWIFRKNALMKHLRNVLYLSSLQSPLSPLKNLNLAITCHCRSSSWFSHEGNDMQNREAIKGILFLAMGFNIPSVFKCSTRRQSHCTYFPLNIHSRPDVGKDYRKSSKKTSPWFVLRQSNLLSPTYCNYNANIS